MNYSVPVIWNFITSADTNKVERIQRKFAALCHNRLFPHARCSYANASEYVKQHTLRDRRNHLDALTFADICVFHDRTSTIIHIILT